MAKLPECVTLDFETEGIRKRPAYPPKPVGVSIKWPGGKTHYYAWGHPTKNNCTFADAKKALELVWKSKLNVCGQNLKFDLDVAEVFFGLPMLPWQRIEDTMFLLFLNDPHADDLSLKPSSERLLKMPPEEQDAVCEWLVANQEDLRATGLLPEDVKISRSKSAKPSKSGEPQYFAAWICLAPGDLVGKYCDGDVIRTEKLWRLLMPSIIKRGMLRAYERERKLVPILLHIERQGIRVDTKKLADDVAMYEATIEDIDLWVHHKLKDTTVNLNSGPQLVAALAKVGLIDLDILGTTPKSKEEKPTYKSDKDSLNAAMTDMQLAGMIQYRSQLGTCLKTFMKPWLKTALASGGLIFTTWNQIRNDEMGARTGRFSSSPNFQNIPQEFKPIFWHDMMAILASAKSDDLRSLPAAQKLLPKCPFENLPKLPMVRSYVIPMWPDHILIDRDFSQQEPRIFAHFEDGPLKDAYNEDPWLDLHDHAQELINDLLNANYKRKPVKQINLGLLYGMGIKLLAFKAEVEEDIARTLKKAVLTIFPGLDKLNKTMKERAALTKPIYTWGGREYYCEPAQYIDGRTKTFDYKMINVLIQGSAADCTKDALIKLWDMMAGHDGWYLLLTVHDEILMSVPSHEFEEAMEVLRLAMESPAFDVPMLSEGTVGMTWAEMQDYDKRGVLV